MGHAIETVAQERGHTTACTIDAEADWEHCAEALQRADVAVEFTTPHTAVQNVRRLISRHLPTVCGTTGWTDSYDDVCRYCKEVGGALFTASNFSLGMNIMFAVSERLSQLMRGREGYTCDITEVHHIHKLDTPSGTALVLREVVGGEVPIASIRRGEVPGVHTLTYASAEDTISLSHEAHSRRGLALGAVLAAEFLCNKQGIFTMRDLL